MRIIFGAMGLLLMLLVVGVLAKKQLGAISPLAPILPQNPALVDQSISRPVTSPGAMPQVQSQHIQQQVKQSLEAALQQSHSMPDDAK